MLHSLNLITYTVYTVIRITKIMRLGWVRYAAQIGIQEI
jgi:hypothetical protein